MASAKYKSSPYCPHGLANRRCVFTNPPGTSSSLGRHPRTRLKTSKTTCEYEFNDARCSFSSKNVHSDLPYTDDITPGPVPEESPSNPISSRSSSPIPSSAEMPAVFQPVHQKIYSERANCRLNQTRTQIKNLVMEQLSLCPVVASQTAAILSVLQNVPYLNLGKVIRV